MLIVAPHTSNWDFLVGVAVAFAVELRASWLGKHSLFRAPFASFLRWLGGIPVNNEIHSTQVRKGAAAAPYISHLMSVSALVLEFGGNETQAIAALFEQVHGLRERPAQS